MKAFITGGAGFIGSHLVAYLLQKKTKVVVFDNLSSGKKEFIEQFLKNPYFTFIKGDLLDKKRLESAFEKDVSMVFHFAANANVKKGIEQTDLDLQQGIIATYNVLDTMRNNNVKKIVFPSSMTVYGASQGISFKENFGPCVPISLYAAAKLGAEGLIGGYCSTFGMKAWIFRFANVIGPHLTHGVIFDLINKLRNDPHTLHVLGDGTQKKPYVYVDDVIHAIFHVIKNTQGTVNIFNIGTKGNTSVKEIVAEICKQMGVSPQLLYDKQRAGWKGDVPECSLNIAKLKSIGFSPRFSSKEAIAMTVKHLLSQND